MTTFARSVIAATEGPLTRQTLIEGFGRYGKPRESWRIGAEFERAVVRPDGHPVPYEGGIHDILDRLADTSNWTRLYEGGALIALSRPDSAHITLEPGGQVELSGAPHATLTGVHDEMHENRDAMLALAQGHDLRWIACGLTPVAAIEDISWMPKGRYAVMRDYLPRKGSLAAAMMKGTCSVQANFDYDSEEDCARKVRLTAGLAPLTTALFANSPLHLGKPTGFMSYRGHIWRHTDPDRTGFPPGLRSDYSHERWVDYLLDVPMMFVLQDGAYLPANGLTFRDYMERGVGGRLPDLDDWALHQTSVFPEVRVKHTIEVRGADCVGHDLAMAFCALFTGLLYCRSAMAEGLSLVEELEHHGTHAERFAVACKGGLDGFIGGRSLADWASDLGDIADRGLLRCLPDDRFMLDPLLARIEVGRSPAHDLLDAWHKNPSPLAIIRSVAY